MRVRNSSEHHPARILIMPCAIAALKSLCCWRLARSGATPARRLAPAQATASEQLPDVWREL